MPRRTVIMGAAGRDFHDFNVCFRGDQGAEVVAFTYTLSQNIGELSNRSVRNYSVEEIGTPTLRSIVVDHAESLGLA